MSAFKGFPIPDERCHTCDRPVRGIRRETRVTWGSFKPTNEVLRPIEVVTTNIPCGCIRIVVAK